MRIRIQNPKNVQMDPDVCTVRMVNTKEEKLHQKIFNYIFQNYIKKSLQINKRSINLSRYNKRILTFILPVLYLPNEPAHFRGFFTSWIRIRNTDCFTTFHINFLFSEYGVRWKHFREFWWCLSNKNLAYPVIRKADIYVCEL